MEKIRYGIISTGRIAKALAEAISRVDGCEVVAVGSRSQESADEFGDKYDIAKRYGTYEELCADADVDVVYIGTPHNLHYDNTLTALKYNKHVLNEKPFTINAHQTEHLIDLAREKGVFMMEAMWTRFMPSVIQAKKWIEEDMIGPIRQVFADFSVPFKFDPKHRLFDPELGGGSLLDLGVYPISHTHFWLGVPDEVHSVAFLGETGVDEHVSAMFTYERGAFAQITCGSQFRGTNEVTVVGEKGYLRFHAPIPRSTQVTIKLVDMQERVVDFPFPDHYNGYEFEVEEVNKCIRDGKTESALRPLDHTLEVMRLMDGMREEWGLEYPME
jgi:dihydrodiol dehydrogenase / D-xylose 1-dehydrogenase (NADP)